MYKFYFAIKIFWDNKKRKCFLQENFKKSLCFTLAHEIYGNLFSHFMHMKWILQNDVNTWCEFYNDDINILDLIIIVFATYGSKISIRCRKIFYGKISFFQFNRVLIIGIKAMIYLHLWHKKHRKISFHYGHLKL